MKPEQAIAIAQDALIWLAGRPADIGRLLAASGVGPHALRAGAEDPEFLGFVLDFLLQSDATVLDFSGEAGLPPEAIARARAALPGGTNPDWT